jgi:hypothetical protein
MVVWLETQSRSVVELRSGRRELADRPVRGDRHVADREHPDQPQGDHRFLGLALLLD